MQQHKSQQKTYSSLALHYVMFRHFTESALVLFAMGSLRQLSDMSSAELTLVCLMLLH